MATTRVRTFSDFAASVARAAGRPGTFAASLFLIVVWAERGRLFTRPHHAALRDAEMDFH